MHRVLLAQFLLAIVVALPVLGLSGAESALATLYGCLLGIANTLITARSVGRSSRAVESGLPEGSEVSLLPLYIGLVNKLLVIAGGIVLGAILLKLHPLYMVLGFAVLQAGYLACRPERV